MTLQGLEGILINVEVDVSGGMPAWTVVGLADTAIKESKERIRTAIKNCDVELLSRKYTINLSPADIRKEGSGLDLAIAVATLKSIGKIGDVNTKDILFLGELSLEGKVKKINRYASNLLRSKKTRNKRNYCTFAKCERSKHC